MIETVVKYCDGSSHTWPGISRREVLECEASNDEMMTEENMKNLDLVIIWYEDNEHEFWAVVPGFIASLFDYYDSTMDGMRMNYTLYKANHCSKI